MNRTSGHSGLALAEAFRIGWLEDTWLQVRAVAVFEEELVGRGEAARPRGGAIGDLAATMSPRRGDALLALRAVIAEVRRGSRSGRDHLVDYVEEYQDREFFFAAVADLERCFGLNRYAGHRGEVKRILRDLQAHAVRVGDQPVAAQLSVPPDALNLEAPLANWTEMLATLDRIHAKPRLRGELRLRMLDQFGVRIPARQRVFHGLHAARELRDESHKRAYALGFARDGYLDARDFKRAAKLTEEIERSRVASGSTLAPRRSPRGPRSR